MTRGKIVLQRERRGVFFCIINPLFGLEYILWASPIMAAVVLFIRLFRTLQLQFPENG